MSNSIDRIIPLVSLKQHIDQWLSEDIPSFDLASLAISSDQQSNAILYCKQSGVLAGLPFFKQVFTTLQCLVQFHADEGEFIVIEPGHKRKIATVSGKTVSILQGERVALNCISRCSGVATLVNRVINKCHTSKWNGRIACTRKTTPGFRIVEKYGVMIGGGDTHRYDLSSMVMLKDNHINACGGDIEKAINSVRKVCTFATQIEVETRNDREALKAFKCGADIIMLDNFTPEDVFETSRIIRAEPDGANVKIDVSGGINESNVLNYISPNVDIISIGNLTQGYDCIDFSLKIGD